MAPWDKAYADLCARLDAHAELLDRIANASENQHSPVLREWELLRLADSAQSASGAGTIYFRPVPLGWEWRVERIAVTVAGASSAAIVVVYVNGIDPTMMADEIVGMDGNSPSRAIADEVHPIRLVGGDQLIVDVTGAATGTNQITARIEGERREQ